MGDIYSSTMRALILLSFLAASALAMPQEKSILTCSLCIDIITDIDEFLTSDPTEQQVVDFAKQICEALEPSCLTWWPPAMPSWSLSSPPLLIALSRTTSTLNRCVMTLPCVLKFFSSYFNVIFIMQIKVMYE